MSKDEALKLAQQGANYCGRRQVVLLGRCGTWVVREINGDLRRGEIGVYPEKAIA